MFITPPEIDQRRATRSLYWQGWRVIDIADHFGIARTTVESWKTRDRWDDYTAIQRVESSLEARLVQLVAKDPKSGSDYKEIDLLGRQIERMARVRRYGEPGGHEGDLNQKIERRNPATPCRFMGRIRLRSPRSRNLSATRARGQVERPQTATRIDARSGALGCVSEACRASALAHGLLIGKG